MEKTRIPCTPDRLYLSFCDFCSGCDKWVPLVDYDPFFNSSDEQQRVAVTCKLLEGCKRAYRLGVKATVDALHGEDETVEVVEDIS